MGDAPDRTPRLRRPLSLTATAALLALAVAVLLAARAYVAEPFGIPSDSMAPTLRPGDQVLANKLAYKLGEPRRGDLAVLHEPRTGDVLLKRIVAVGGDTVEIRDGELFVDERRVREPFVDHRTVDSVYFGPVRVPRGRVFVLGDNRANSVDSRAFGSVPRDRLMGRVAARFWPLHAVGNPG